MKKPALEVAHIFRQFSDQYIQKYKPPIDHLKVISAIINCRTAKLGGHIESCSSKCGYERIAYNSCRNRHCPKCQFSKAKEWIQSRQNDLLPVPYFHVVFTLPAQKLLPLILPNKKVFYTLMFECVSETLLELGKDPKWLGAKTGAICVLHTWTQRLIFHPHIHCIVPAGGLSENQWVHSLHFGFFVPFKVLAKLFQYKLLSKLKVLHQQNKLSFLKDDQDLHNPQHFQDFCQSLYHQPWIAYAKPAFEGPKSVIQYLGQYIHKIAISNYRLLKLDQDTVSFIYRDRKNGNTKKATQLNALDFMKLFLQHILPYQFSKIRYYGFLSNRSKKKSLLQIKTLLEEPTSYHFQSHPQKPKQSHNRCPNCQKGNIIKPE